MAAGFITAAICVEMTENFFFFFILKTYNNWGHMERWLLILPQSKKITGLRTAIDRWPCCE